MASFDVWLFGEKSEIDRLAEICKRVGEILEDKYGLDEDNEFIDFTGVGVFLTCYGDFDRTLHGQKVECYDEEEIAEEWLRCSPLEEDKAAIWWAQIESPQKMPTEVLEYIQKESKKLGIQPLVEKLIRKLSSEDAVTTESIESRLNRMCSTIKHLHRATVKNQIKLEDALKTSIVRDPTVHLSRVGDS